MNLFPEHLNLYRKIAWLFVVHARPAILEQTNFAAEADPGDEKSGSGPEDFAKSLEKMGPTFVKLGQLLSTRADLLPMRYIEALERLQDNVEPIPLEEVKQTIEAQLKVKLSTVFAHFEDEPVASASLGQVHRATLRDGREVVVKVQRPGVRNTIQKDLEALDSVARYADEHTELGRLYQFGGIVEQFRRTIIDELDYQLEAQNLSQMSEVLKDFRRIVIPKAIDGFCSDKVLTMDYIDGVKITDLPGVRKTELDGETLAEEIFRAYLRQVLIAGFYHADPHPGNVLLTSEGRVGLIDLGMVGRLSESLRDKLFTLLAAVSENDSDKVGEVALRLATSGTKVVNSSAFTSDLASLVGRAHDSSVSNLQFGSVVMEIMRICAEHGLRIPREISSLGKTLLNLDRIAISLAPGFSPNNCIRENISKLARERSIDSIKQGNLMSAVLEMKELVSKSPQRINDLLSLLAENRLRIDVDAVDEVALIKGFQKIANRVALGAIIGAMVIGSSFMMDIDSEYRIFGYAALPMAMLLLSALLGVSFLYSILKNDK